MYRYSKCIRMFCIFSCQKDCNENSSKFSAWQKLCTQKNTFQLLYNYTLNSCLTQPGSRDEILWSPCIEGQWIAKMPANHSCRTITGSDAIKQNEGRERWNEICDTEKWKKPREKRTQTHFIHHETNMEWLRLEFLILKFLH